MNKSLIIAILVFGLIECAILLLISLTPGVENAAGLSHPQLLGMRIGGAGAVRIAPIAILAFLFQTTVLAQFATFIALAVTAKRRSPVFYSFLSLCFVFTIGVWWRLFSGHQQYLATGETQYFLGFPVATAWAVYGVYLAGVSFIVLYVLGFKKFIWSDQDESEFQQLVNKNNTTQIK